MSLDNRSENPEVEERVQDERFRDDRVDREALRREDEVEPLVFPNPPVGFDVEERAAHCCAVVDVTAGVRTCGCLSWVGGCSSSGGCDTSHHSGASSGGDGNGSLSEEPDSSPHPGLSDVVDEGWTVVSGLICEDCRADWRIGVALVSSGDEEASCDACGKGLGSLVTGIGGVDEDVADNPFNNVLVPDDFTER